MNRLRLISLCCPMICACSDGKNAAARDKLCSGYQPGAPFSASEFLRKGTELGMDSTMITLDAAPTGFTDTEVIALKTMTGPTLSLCEAIDRDKVSGKALASAGSPMHHTCAVQFAGGQVKSVVAKDFD